MRVFLTGLHAGGIYLAVSPNKPYVFFVDFAALFSVIEKKKG
jgi:hypothetical protein